MKRVLVLLIAACMVGGLSASVPAAPFAPQGKPAAKQPAKPAMGSQEWADSIHNRVVNSLGLTAAQKKGILAAYDKQKSAQAKIMKDYPFKGGEVPNNKKRSDALMKSSTAFSNEAKKALGAKYPTYLKKLQEETQKEMEKMGYMPSQAKIEAAMKAAQARVAKQMGLTAAQQKSIATIEAKAKKDSEALQSKMMGAGATPTKAQSDKFGADIKKISDTRTAALKKLLGATKAADYDKRLRTEMQKEFEKLMSQKPPAGTKPKG